MKYRTKTQIVDAFQLTKEKRWDNVDWPQWMHIAWNEPNDKVGSVYPEVNKDHLYVVTESGTEFVNCGDWIIKDNDAFAVMPDDEFQEKYQKINSSTTKVHIVIDIETLSTETNAAITSIGMATVFQNGNDITVYDLVTERNVSLDSYDQYDGEFHISAQTIGWWLSQTKEAQQAMLNNTVPLEVALQSVITHILSLSDSYQIAVYGFGVTFDIQILEHAFNVVGMKAPWTYRDVRCLRTLCNVFDVNYNDYMTGEKHRSGSDALAEAKALKEILEKI